eukprot:387916_1
MKRKHYHFILIILFVFINSINTQIELNIWQQHQPQYPQCMNNIVNGNTVSAEQLSNIIQERMSHYCNNDTSQTWANCVEIQDSSSFCIENTNCKKLRRSKKVNIFLNFIKSKSKPSNNCNIPNKLHFINRYSWRDMPRDPILDDIKLINTTIKYIEINKNGCQKTHVVFPNLEHFPQNEVLEIIQIDNHPRIPSLNGKLGLRARMYIPKYSILGNYCGNEYFASDIYTQCDFNYITEYWMSAAVINVNNNKIIKDIVIDPYRHNPLIYANDFRINLSNKYPNTNERMFENMGCYQLISDMNKNGLVLICIAIKDICLGCEINHYYGPNWNQKTKN